jgi:Tol biopolymer transport system component
VIPVPTVPGVRGLTIAGDGRRLAFAGLALDSQIWAQSITAEGVPRGPARPLTTDTSRRKSLAAVAPDGRHVAYMASRRGDPPDIWVMDIDGGNRVQLTSDETADGEPAWYPDGRRIAYRSMRRDGSIGMWAVDMTTRRSERLADLSSVQPPLPPGTARPAGSLAELRFSPTMTRAAFSLREPTLGFRRLFVTDVTPYAPRPLTDGTRWTGYPAWSPDETRLAVEVKDGSSTHAAIVDVRSGALTRVNDGRGQTWVRSWSPDGRKVAVAALRDGQWSVRWVAADGSGEGEIVPPTAPNVYVRYPDWSARGDVVVFERGELTGNIWALAID